MVAPLIAAAVLGAGANYYTSEQNRKANQQLQDQMMDRLNGVALPKLSEEDYAYQGIDPSLLSYSDYQYGGDYSPEMGQYVQEQGPQLVERNEAAKYGRDAQMEALKKFRSNIQSGYDPEFAAKLDQASQKSQGDAQSRMASILQDAERRGQLGSNATLARQMQGSSDAMNRGAMESQQAAVEAYRNQLQQQRDSASLGAQVAGAEEQMASQNAGIKNSFNERTSRAYQQYLNQQNEMLNQANLRNLNTKQQIGNQNIDTRNRQAADQFKAQQAERAYKNQLATQRQGVKQSNFNNQLSRASGQNMLGAQQQGLNNQSAMAQIGAIQGLSQGVTGYYQNEENAAARQKQMDWQANENAMDRQAYQQRKPPSNLGSEYTDDGTRWT